MEGAFACKKQHSKADAAARKCGEPNGERVRIKRHGRSMPRQGAAGRGFCLSMIFSENRFHFSGSCSSGAMVRWKGCDSFRMAGGNR